MTAYTIHMAADAAPHPRDAKGVTYFDSLAAVPDGVAKWAIVAPPLWLAWHRLWMPLGVYLLVVAGFLSLALTPFAPIGVALAFMPGFYLFLEGNQLRRARLGLLGYETVSVVEAPDEETAVMRFLSHWDAAHPEGPHGLDAPAPVPARAGSRDAAPEGAFGVMGAA